MYPVYQKCTTDVSDLHGFENPWLIYKMEDNAFSLSMCSSEEQRFLLTISGTVFNLYFDARSRTEIFNL